MFGKYAAAIYEPNLVGSYEVLVYCGTFADMDDKAPWIVKHRDGYTRVYVTKTTIQGGTTWYVSVGCCQSDVRLVYPDYFEPTRRRFSSPML